MSLEDRLKRLKQLESEKKESDWKTYKETWVKDIIALQHLIMDKWFESFGEQGLMIFSIIPTQRLEPYVGEYLTSTLEITISKNNFFALEPVACITSDYDGKLEFYMLGNVYKKINIMRKLMEGKASEWIIATSYDPKSHYPLTKEELEKTIDVWLS